MSVFSQRLSALRKARGVSQRSVAGDLQISQALLSHYENGIREPGLDFVARVCDYYGVSADSLLGLGGADVPSPPPDPPEEEQFLSTIRFLWKLLDSVGGPELLKYGRDFVYDAVYKVFRHVFKYLREDPHWLQVSSTDYSFLSDADMKLCELRLLRLLKALPADAVLSPEELCVTQPELAEACRAVVASVSARLAE